MEAHHIKPKAKFPNEAYDDNNGVALCQKCHKEYHNKYGGSENQATFLKWAMDKQRGY